MAETRLDDSTIFKFGPPMIQTPEDAHNAFLRGHINEDELEQALGKFGAVPGTVNAAVKPLPRIDEGFALKIPDEILLPEEAPGTSTQEKIDAQDEKRKNALKATKDAASGTNKVERQETVPVGTAELEKQALENAKNADKPSGNQEKVAEKNAAK